LEFCRRRRIFRDGLQHRPLRVSLSEPKSGASFLGPHAILPVRRAVGQTCFGTLARLFVCLYGGASTYYCVRSRRVDRIFRLFAPNFTSRGTNGRQQTQTHTHTHTLVTYKSFLSWYIP
jgi:hypothetical protein